MGMPAQNPDGHAGKAGMASKRHRKRCRSRRVYQFRHTRETKA
jgi:hypothetical protein